MSRRPSASSQSQSQSQLQAHSSQGQSQDDELVVALDPDMPVLLVARDVIDKLRILRYPYLYSSLLHSHAQDGSVVLQDHQLAFASSASGTGSFVAFGTAAAWLLTQLGAGTTAPSAFDDPSGTASEILASCRTVGIIGDFAPAKLRPGCGPAVVALLNALVDRCLFAAGFAVGRIVHRDASSNNNNGSTNLHNNNTSEGENGGGNGEDGEDVESDGEDIGDVPDDAWDSGDEGPGPGSGGMTTSTGSSSGATTTHGAGAPTTVAGGLSAMEGGVDVEAWKLELERVGPQLKLKASSTVGGSGGSTATLSHRDWRSHVEALSRSLSELSTTTQPTISKQLARVSDECARHLDKIARREKSIHGNCDLLASEFRAAQTDLLAAQSQVAHAQALAAARTQMLADVGDELQAMKHTMEKKGAEMTNTGPLVAIKDAIRDVRKDLAATEFQMGVLRTTVIQNEAAARSSSRPVRHSVM
eukprot:ANDGO_01247.mRNA.1 Intraflagellar transport protein 57